MFEDMPSGFVHPISKKPLFYNKQKDLFQADGPENILFKNYNGSYDFVREDITHDDRLFYDERYEELIGKKNTLTSDCLKRMWKEQAGFPFLLNCMGKLQNKRVLLIGNGTSYKELYFLLMGAEVVYSDVSISAAKHVRDIFQNSDLIKNNQVKIEFHAIDAINLPFPNESFDIIYGCAFTHHLGDLNPFFDEVTRVLKKEGNCIFYDDAYSPIWHTLKNTVLKPLQLFSHRKTGISPADLIATKKGGFRKSELVVIMNKYRFNSITFEKQAFFEYLVQRGSEKSGIEFFRHFLSIARKIDKFLQQKVHFIDKQGIRLIWGFGK